MEVHAGQFAAAQQGQGGVGVASAHGIGQWGEFETLRLTVTAQQVHAVAGESAAVRVAAGVAEQRVQRLRVVRLQGIAGAGGLQDRGEHVAGFHRGQLVGVAEQDQLGAVGDGFDQFAHQRQVDHGGFVDHDQVERQRVVGIKAEARHVGDDAEQAVQGAGASG